MTNAIRHAKTKAKPSVALFPATEISILRILFFKNLAAIFIYSLPIRALISQKKNTRGRVCTAKACPPFCKPSKKNSAWKNFYAKAEEN